MVPSAGPFQADLAKRNERFRSCGFTDDFAAAGTQTDAQKRVDQRCYRSGPLAAWFVPF